MLDIEELLTLFASLTMAVQINANAEETETIYRKKPIDFEHAI